MSPDLALRQPAWTWIILLQTMVTLPLYVRSSAAMAAHTEEPTASLVLRILVILPFYLFIIGVAMTGLTLPTRFSATGLRTRAAHLFRYDIDVDWEGIDRIWLTPGRVIHVRLHDPDAVAGRSTRLRERMRHNRRRTGADLHISTTSSVPSGPGLAEAIHRLSGGRHTLATSRPPADRS
ncbi:hypothetical protein [Catenuloplanes atrovinosus]|uniref:PH domain-containing protein n=1 Tax=Catenuloplanes atrovinosus TaxID=137266 RepID=A0AAE4C7R5_9ACTN|nr:hypothetical protein [Catenuloplanes atrovinosus]MDR7273822.1 hypothetical protein [Catenuloplanes atrovinosus]